MRDRDMTEIITCPECLEECDQEELNVFGGLCEACANAEHDNSPLFLPGDTDI